MAEPADDAHAFVGELARRISVPEPVSVFMLAMVLLAGLYLVLRGVRAAGRPSIARRD